MNSEEKHQSADFVSSIRIYPLEKRSQFYWHIPQWKEAPKRLKIQFDDREPFAIASLVSMWFMPFNFEVTVINLSPLGRRFQQNHAIRMLYEIEPQNDETNRRRKWEST